MTSMASSSVDVKALLPAMLISILELPLERFESGDYFQQILNIDSTLETLSESRDFLTCEIRSLLRATKDFVPTRDWKGLRSSRIQDLGSDDTEKYEYLYQALTNLDKHMKVLEELQTRAREQHRLQARSMREKEIHILDFPVELQKMIFNNFQPLINLDDCRPTFGDESDVSTIRAIQQTCPVFRQNSSHLLVRHLDISPCVSSIKHLEQVLQYTEIWRAERVLRVDLRYYSATLAGDFQAFSDACIRGLEHKVMRFTYLLHVCPVEEEYREEIKDPLQGWEGSDDISEEEVSNGIPEEDDISEEGSGDGSEEGSEGSRVIWPAMRERWESLCNKLTEKVNMGLISRERVEKGVMQAALTKLIWKGIDLGYQLETSLHLDTAKRALRRAHKRYRNLFQQQDSILKDGSFIRKVALAAAESRSTVWLSMWEGNDDFRSYDHWYVGRQLDEQDGFDLDLFDKPDKLVQSIMAQPRRWQNSNLEDEEAPQSLLYEIPLAMRTAGAQLAGLTVDITSFPRKLELRLWSNQLLNLGEAIRDLKMFSFRLKTRPLRDLRVASSYQVSPEALDGLYAYLLAPLGSKAVLGLSLNPFFSTVDDAIGLQRYSFHIEPLLRSPNWHKLKWANLWNFDISIEELRRFIDMLQQGIILGLKDIRLTSGTWAESLYCLRAKVGKGSYVVSPRGRPKRLHDYYEIFGQEGDEVWRAGKATQYINRAARVDNPLIDTNGHPRVVIMKRGPVTI